MSTKALEGNAGPGDKILVGKIQAQKAKVNTINKRPVGKNPVGKTPVGKKPSRQRASEQKAGGQMASGQKARGQNYCWQMSFIPSLRSLVICSPISRSFLCSFNSQLRIN